MRVDANEGPIFVTGKETKLGAASFGMACWRRLGATPRKAGDIAAAAMIVLILSVISTVVFHHVEGPGLAFDMRSDAPGVVQVFFDYGRGVREEDSARQTIAAGDEFQELYFPATSAVWRGIRLDPLNRGGEVTIRNLRITQPGGSDIPVPYSALQPAQQVDSVSQSDGVVRFHFGPEANDPIVTVNLDWPLDLTRSGGWLRFLLAMLPWALAWGAAVCAFRFGVPYLARRPEGVWLAAHPRVLIALTALVASLAACSPVVLWGKSFMSPQLGAPLFYDTCPTLPADTDCVAENVRGADVGAVSWAHFPMAVIQERALKKDGEFPLWNRYNSAGVPMLGQGLEMIGDPFRLMQWVVGPNALTFDIMYVLLRAILAGALGLSVFAVTRSVAPSLVVTIAMPFLGFFLFRVNHPAIYMLCYSALIPLCWMGIVYTVRERARIWWLSGLIGANWCALTSGAPKEGVVAMLVLNALGAVHFLSERRRTGGELLRWLGLFAAGGFCFALISAPVWGSLLYELETGFSVYEIPAVTQYPVWNLADLFDTAFVLARTDLYAPTLNALLAIGCLLGMIAMVALDAGRARRAAWVYGAGALFLAFSAFGVVPGRVFLAIPFINNIHHIDTTFVTVLIPPAAILAGVGFYHVQQILLARRWRQGAWTIAAVVFAVQILVLMYLLPFASDGGLEVRRAIPFFAATLAAAIIVPWALMFTELQRKSLAAAALCLLLLCVVLARGATYPRTNFESVFLNLPDRIDIRGEPAIVERLRERLDDEPARVAGIGYVLMAGFQGALGLEGLSAPDAVHDRRYREFATQAGLPYIWGWRVAFDIETMAAASRTLDLLGLRYVFASAAVDPESGMTAIDHDGRLTLYERPTAWPRAFYASGVTVADGLDQFMAALASADAGPFVAVYPDVIAAHPEIPVVSDPAAERIVPASDYRLTNNTTGFTVEASGPGLIYLGEAGAPWDFRATLNGGAAQIVTANHAFKAIPVNAAGVYRVSVSYWPSYLGVALVAMLAGLIGWGGIMWCFLRRPVAREPFARPRRLPPFGRPGRPRDGVATPGNVPYL